MSFPSMVLTLWYTLCPTYWANVSGDDVLFTAFPIFWLARTSYLVISLYKSPVSTSRQLTILNHKQVLQVLSSKSSSKEGITEWGLTAFRMNCDMLHCFSSHVVRVSMNKFRNSRSNFLKSLIFSCLQFL